MHNSVNPMVGNYFGAAKHNLAAANLAQSLMAAFTVAVRQPTLKRRGRVCEALGGVLRVTGVQAHIGQLCQIDAAPAQGGAPVLAEVLSFSPSGIAVVPFAPIQRIFPGAEVDALDMVHSIAVGSYLLGRTVDGLGQPMDGMGIPPDCEWRPVLADPPNPLERPLIDRVLSCGVRVLDAMATLGCGQRVGLFSAAGGGKTTLLRMLAQHTTSDVVVLAIVGERGREVNELLRALSANGSRKKIVCVATTSDRPPIERARAAFTATTIAEYFRDQGAQVLLLLDSITRVARAQRELGLSIGETPTRRGYPVSVFSNLARLVERAGPHQSGGITAIYTVLVEDEQLPDPVAEEVRSILDGHIVLSRELGERGHYPAVDVLASLSRVMRQLVPPAHQEMAQTLRSLMAKYREIEMLQQMGELIPGRDRQADLALAAIDPINHYLRQSPDEACDLQTSLQQLTHMLASLTVKRGLVH